MPPAYLMMMAIPLVPVVLAFATLFQFLVCYTAGIESGYFGTRRKTIGFRLCTGMPEEIGLGKKIDELNGEFAGNVLDRATVIIRGVRDQLGYCTA